MGWGIFEKLFSSKKQRSASQPALKTSGIRHLNTTNTAKPVRQSIGNNSLGNNSLASASSAPDLASRIANNSSLHQNSKTKSLLSESNTRSKPTRPADPNVASKSFGEALNSSISPDNIDTDEEVNTNFSPRSNANNNNNNNNSTASNGQLKETLTNTSKLGAYLSSESSSESRSKQPGKQQVNIFSDLEKGKERRGSTSESIVSSSEVSSLPKVSTGKSIGKKSIGTLEGTSFGQVSSIERVGTGIRMGLSQSVTFREPEAIVLGQEKKTTSGNDKWEEKRKKLEDEIGQLRIQLLAKTTREKREIDLLMAKFYDGVSSQTEKQKLRALFVSEQQAYNEKVMNEQANVIEQLQLKCKRLKPLNNEDLSKETVLMQKELQELKSLVYRLNLAAEEKEQKLVILQKRVEFLDKSQTEAEKIRMQAEVVLEENTILREQAALREARQVEMEKMHVKEVGRLSKRIIVTESDKVNLQSQLDLFAENHDELLKKLERCSQEMQRRMTVEEHLKVSGDLTRKVDEQSLKHREEMQTIMMQLESANNERNNLTVKCTNLLAENKKLLAENQVVEKALEEGIGRKTQKKLHDLEKRLAESEHSEKIAQAALMKLVHEIEKLKQHKSEYLSLMKSSEIEARKSKNRIAEENLKKSRLEEKFEDFKERAALTLAKSLKKNEASSEQLARLKAESEKKLNDVVNLLEKKDRQIEECIKEKQVLESEMENFCESTLSGNKKFKEVLLNI